MWESVRKFGLDYCDLPTMLSNVSTLLRILALNIDGRNHKRIPVMYIMITTISTTIYVYGYVFSAYWFIFWRSPQTGDLTSAFIEFSLNVTSAIGIIKLFYMMFYREKLKQLTNKYLEHDARIMPSSRFSSNMLKTLRKVKLRGTVYWWIMMVDAIVYVIKPLVMPGRHLTMEGFIIYGLEPMLESPNYEIATVGMAIAVIFICYVVANVTCFLILILGYIEAQMLAISDEIIHLWEDAKYYCNSIANTYKTVHRRTIIKSSVHETLNEYIEKHLIDIIGRHSITKSHLQEIEDIMRVPNAIGFLLLIMGLIAELLGGLEQTYLQLPFTMLQLSVDCYLGQKVIDSNLKFEEAVYNCRWEKFNKSNRKIVLMMLRNSQKTMTLTAGGMATLSFTCLMSIIRTTYSAYTTLRSMV